MEELLISMEDFVPTIPDEVTSYYLNTTGFVCPDIRVRRLVTVAAQKLISDIVNSSMQYHKLKESSKKTKTKTEKKIVLTTEDLSQSLRDYGINLYKAPYFADNISAGVTIKEKGAKNKDPSTKAAKVTGKKRKRALKEQQEA